MDANTSMLNKYLAENEKKSTSMSLFEDSIKDDIEEIKAIVSKLKLFAVTYNGSSFIDDIDDRLCELSPIIKKLQKMAECYDGLSFIDELDEHLKALFKIKKEDRVECSELNELDEYLEDLV